MVACHSGPAAPSPRRALAAEGPRRCLRCAARRQLLLSSAQRVAIADLRLAAWFLWMTPLLAALSRLCDAVRMATAAASTSPASAASRNLRTAVLSDDLTALLRCRAFSFCLLRLIWDLIFATRVPRLDVLSAHVCSAITPAAMPVRCGQRGARHEPRGGLRRRARRSRTRACRQPAQEG